MAIDCNAVAQEELRRLRDIQRLLQLLAIALYGSLENANLEDVL